jgi:hypothetical protein
MKQELSGLKSRRTRVLNDKNLTAEERKKLNERYIDLIQKRTKQITNYMKQSEIPEQLK